MVKKENDEIPHPRKRINAVFEDGETVVVHLKDRSQEETSDENEWYERAFGSQRNIMHTIITFRPVNDVARK